MDFSNIIDLFEANVNFEELEIFDKAEYYYRLSQQINCEKSMRKHIVNALINLIRENEELQNVWEIDENQNFYKDKVYKKMTKQLTWRPFEGCEPMEKGGLYLIGSTHFDPFTNETYYWIKVGLATNLKDRMKTYATHNPMLWRQAYYVIIDKVERTLAEDFCHRKLKEIAIEIGNNSHEWFRVTREQYLEICEKEFDYFFK